MRPDYRICDKCKSGKVPESQTLFACTGRSMDAAGSMDSEGHQVDLCHACAIEAIKALLREEGSSRRDDYDNGRRLIRFLGKQV